MYSWLPSSAPWQLNAIGPQDRADWPPRTSASPRSAQRLRRSPSAPARPNNPSIRLRPAAAHHVEADVSMVVRIGRIRSHTKSGIRDRSTKRRLRRSVTSFDLGREVKAMGVTSAINESWPGRAYQEPGPKAGPASCCPGSRIFAPTKPCRASFGSAPESYPAAPPPWPAVDTMVVAGDEVGQRSSTTPLRSRAPSRSRSSPTA